MPLPIVLYIIAAVALLLAVITKAKGAFFTICAFGVVLGVVLQVNMQK